MADTRILAHIRSSTRYLKITEKVSFNIAIEASYVSIWSGQKLMKNAKTEILESFCNKTFLVIFKQCAVTAAMAP